MEDNFQGSTGCETRVRSVKSVKSVIFVILTIVKIVQDFEFLCFLTI